MSNYDYQVRISKLSLKDGGGFIALVPELPGCMSDGETYEEAIKNVKGAIDDWIKAATFRGQPIPEPIQYVDDDDFSGKLMIRIPKKLHKELVDQAADQEISLNQLILYYLSKQTGIQEEKKITKNIEKNDDNIDNEAEKANRIFNITMVNIPNKNWNSLGFIPHQLMQLNTGRSE